MANDIAQYLTKFKDRLELHYTWTFDPEIPRKEFGITCGGDTWPYKLRQLKAGLVACIESSNNVNDLERVALYFIKTWGGISGFRSEAKTVQNFRDISGAVEIPADRRFEFASISSWSKWLSLSCPKWACIYDARVVYSINSINYLNGAGSPIFPSPEGRNTKLKMFDVSTLLLSSRIDASDVRNPQSLRARYFVPKSDAYRTYVRLVADVSRLIWGDVEHVHDVEMLLFALADTHVYEAVFARMQASNVELVAVA